LNVTSFEDFWNVWGTGTEPFPGQIKYTFWHVTIWSWFANGAMHVGMSDLSVFRFAKKPSLGWTSAAGMYVGHYMAWISAALLYAVYIKTPEAQALLDQGQAPSVAPGPLAYNAIGVFGIIAIIAGWTTANPTIYRAGLAFQAILPKYSTVRVTLIAGSIATIAGLFPAFAMKLLDFVALYGFILAPMGAIIVFNHFYRGDRGIKVYSGNGLNVEVLISWILPPICFYYISINYDVFLSFLIVPAWILSGLLYLTIARKQIN
jgi:NCS1 family nucleobase:cation symporter-1